MGVGPTGGVDGGHVGGVDRELDREAVGVDDVERPTVAMIDHTARDARSRQPVGGVLLSGGVRPQRHMAERARPVAQELLVVDRVVLAGLVQDVGKETA